MPFVYLLAALVLEPPPCNNSVILIFVVSCHGCLPLLLTTDGSAPYASKISILSVKSLVSDRLAAMCNAVLPQMLRALTSAPCYKNSLTHDNIHSISDASISGVINCSDATFTQAPWFTSHSVTYTHACISSSSCQSQIPIVRINESRIHGSPTSIVSKRPARILSAASIKRAQASAVFKSRTDIRGLWCTQKYNLDRIYYS